MFDELLEKTKRSGLNITEYFGDKAYFRNDQGNKTIKKYHKVRKSGKQSLKYYFDCETCRNCPFRAECITANTMAKIMEVGVNTPEFYHYSQRQKSDEFKGKYRKRACQEWNNGR